MKNTVIKKMTNAVVIIMMIITMVATTAVVTPVDAATPKTPAKVTGVKASNITGSSVKLSWKKIAKNKNTKGYAIYRNGKEIKKVGAKVNSFTDTGLASGTKYTYTVKAYNTYKQKQYYNSKTKKWQNKKPAKKNWKGKKTRTVTLRKYGKFSNVATVRTKNVVVNTPKPIPKPITVCTHDWADNNNTNDNIMKGMYYQKCTNCNATRTRYAKWTTTQKATEEDVVINYVSVNCMYLSCTDVNCTCKAPSHVKAGTGDVDWFGNEGIVYFADDGLEDYKIVADWNYFFNTNFTTIEEVKDDAVSIELYRLNEVFELNCNTYEEACEALNMKPNNAKGLAVLRLFDYYNIESGSLHRIGDSAVDRVAEVITVPAQKEKGYWSFENGSYTASEVGWTSTLTNNKEIVAPYYVF